MKSDAVAFGIAGICFGLIAGWMIGSQQAAMNPSQSGAASAPQAANQPAGTPAAPPLDQSKVDAAKAAASREPSNPAPRVELGNLYFDADRCDDAIRWYLEALSLNPRDVNVSTDLGVCYYYSNQPDKAIDQLNASLKIDPKHAKTVLNMGIVKAFGKQDLKGAEEAWQQVVKLAPESDEGKAAKRAIDSVRSAHPDLAASPKPGG